jgi:hypothetical protein
MIFQKYKNSYIYVGSLSFLEMKPAKKAAGAIDVYLKPGTDTIGGVCPRHTLMHH